jgi:hypothetical protein
MGNSMTCDFMPEGKENRFSPDLMYEIIINKKVELQDAKGKIYTRKLRTKPLDMSHKKFMELYANQVKSGNVQWQMWEGATDEEIEQAKKQGKKEPRGQYVNCVSPSELKELNKAKSVS